MKRILVALLIICLSQTYGFSQKYERPQIPTPKTFRSDPAAQPDHQSLANLKWFEVFKDEKLQELIREALANNYDLREATARPKFPWHRPSCR